MNSRTVNLALAATAAGVPLYVAFTGRTNKWVRIALGVAGAAAAYRLYQDNVQSV